MIEDTPTDVPVLDHTIKLFGNRYYTAKINIESV
jgi:hypothetical protein